MPELSYWLDVRRPGRRRIEVTAELEVAAFAGAGQRTDATSQEFFLATWTPGSYLIREYSRHLGSVQAKDPITGQRLGHRKVAKNRIRVDVPQGTSRIRLEYTVYAHELSVRTSDLTTEHAYWNHACVLLWPVDQLHASARIGVRMPDGWQLATALPTEATPDGPVMLADDFARAVDAPCLAAKFTRTDWAVRGVPHSLVLDGLASVRVPQNLLADLTRLIECAADVFDGALPYPSYLFLCLFSDSGHGGLEHTDSTTLLSSRTALHRNREYRDFLSLAVHELFHAWNVKRMRPVEFWNYDYERETYTSMLWLAEGFTAYYDDLLCRRAKVHSVADYLGILAKTTTAWLSGTGRLALSLADSSFDAWIRLYRPDENTRNSSQNYYGNGSIAALVLDLTIRTATKGERSLDHALRELYRTTFAQGRGYTRQDVAHSLSFAAGLDLEPLLSRLVDGALEPDLAPLLAAFGVKFVQRDRDKPYLGMSFDGDRLVVNFVNENGPAFESGIAPGDEVIALNGLRVTSGSWAEVAEATLTVGTSVRVLTASRGVITERSITPTPNPTGSIALELDPAASPEAVALREGWLGKPESA